MVSVFFLYKILFHTIPRGIIYDLNFMRNLKKNTFEKYFVLYTGWRDQIVRPVNLILLPNQKTCRKCKDSFGIVSNRATKYVYE